MTRVQVARDQRMADTLLDLLRDLPAGQTVLVVGPVVGNRQVQVVAFKVLTDPVAP